MAACKPPEHHVIGYMPSCGCAQVYVWGRRHPYVSLSFLGVFTFSAPYLPWVLLGFSVILRSSPVVDLCGMVAGAPSHAVGCSA